MFRNFIPVLFSIFFQFSFEATIQAQEPLYPTLETGVHTPDVIGKNEKGKNISLSKIKSRLTLIYFYEVHCHLCESMVLRLKELYEAYHKTGLEIVAVPVNSEKDEWINYIKENQLPWKHIYPNRNVEAMKSHYLLTVSPTFYLVDKNHVLLTKRMARLEEVEEALNIHSR